jgi:hypothetical protein
MSFGNLLGGLMNVEGSVRETITRTLEDLSEELNEPNFKNFSITIQPINEDFDFVCLIYHITDSGRKFIREIELKEIVSN